jgi:DNA polymerase III sliding clamp (beta) subunit (PCNA family)
MITDLLDLSEMEDEEEELVPEILPVDARLAISGSAKALSALIQSAVDIAPMKEIISNTSYVRIQAFSKNSKHVSYVQVSATDGERSIAVLDDSMKIRLAGSVLIHGKKLLDVLRLVPEDTIRLDVLGTSLTVRSGRAVWTLSTPPSEYDLPDFANVDDIPLHTVKSADLLEALSLVLPAVSKTQARHSLMQAEVANRQITACDGIRAHRVTIPDLPKEFSTTLPLRFIESAIKELRAHSDEDVQIGSDNSTVVLRFSRDSLISQRLNFDYPSVNHLLLGPALANEESLTLNVKDLMDTVKRVRVNADPDYSALYLSVRGEGEATVAVRARDKNGNSSQEVLEAEFDGKKARDIVVNHRYLTEFLACIEFDTCTLKLGESTKSKQAPIYVETEKFTGSLMPMAPAFVKN